MPDEHFIDFEHWRAIVDIGGLFLMCWIFAMSAKIAQLERFIKTELLACRKGVETLIAATEQPQEPLE